MVNLSVAYQRPDGAAASLWAEIQAWAGPRAQTKGFVAGSGPTAWNVSSHNADNLGIAHAVDIGVDIEDDGTGLTLEQAEWLAEHLRELGRIDWAAGRPGRLAYIIYRGRIAGDHTGWDWIAYTGSSPHLDHIHVSTTFDFYWGDPVWGTPQYIWDDRGPWGISTAPQPQSGTTTITPLEEDPLANLDPDTLNEIADAVLRRKAPNGRMLLELVESFSPVMDAVIAKTIDGVLNTELPDVRTGGTTTLAKQVSWASADARIGAEVQLPNDIEERIRAGIDAKLADLKVTLEATNG